MRVHRDVSGAGWARPWSRLAFVVCFVAVGCTAEKGDPEVPAAVIEDAGADLAVLSDGMVDFVGNDDAGDFLPPVEWGRHTIDIVDTERIVPSTSLPPEIDVMQSNNNLDVIRHQERLYLAWRTAPDHFASSETRIHVVSRVRQEQWRWEAEFSVANDLREPRFLEAGGALHLYLAELGSNAAAFEPRQMLYSRLLADGDWSPLTPFYRPGFIPWRAKTERGVPYLVAYEGGENIYQFNGLPLSIELLTTSDGVEFMPLDDRGPVVSTGGGSETDFVLTDDGDLLAVIRNEAGDDTGWGSKICRAPAENLYGWTCRHDRKKYDSPLMFWYDGEAYLVARRHLTPDGFYDLGQREERPAVQSARYQLAYIQHRKRCSIWRYVQSEDRIAFLADLPSRGDTCFPALVATDVDGEFDVFNYSSPIDGDDVAWKDGQRGPTYLYRHRLRFLRRDDGGS